MTNKLRFEILKRDEFKCQYCGKTSPDVILEVDHIFPVALGGKTLKDNLITSCRSCNRGKYSRPINNPPIILKHLSLFTAIDENVLVFEDFLLLSRDIFNAPLWKKFTPAQTIVSLTLLSLFPPIKSPKPLKISLNQVVLAAGKGITTKIVRTTLNKLQKYNYLLVKNDKNNLFISLPLRKT